MNPTLRDRIMYRVRRWTPFKSQKGQDVWVAFRALPLKFGGYFVDLAAADGVENSNTLALEKIFGWRGICIEPNPVFFEQLKRTRKAALENCAVSDREETVQFRYDTGQFGGIMGADIQHPAMRKDAQDGRAKILEVRTVRLETILVRNQAPEIIDYLSLDVEGCEESVLADFDFSRYRFRCMTIERPTERLRAVLSSQGYRMVKEFRHDAFFVHGKG